MENNKLFKVIEQAIQNKPSEYQLYKDLFDLCVSSEKEMFDIAHEYSAKLRQYISRELKSTTKVEEFYSLYKNALLFDAPHFFDAYMQYLEIDRKPQERFYQPRRKVLKPIVDALQDLVDDKLDELFISQPPRTGKTTTLLFFMTWCMGRFPESTNLYSAFSDSITSMFYTGLLEVLNDPNTYKWNEIFPTCKIPTGGTNSKDETLDINRVKKYHTFTSRSLYGTLNGSCDCNGILVADDLLSGIEEALSPDRLKKAWMITDNNLLARAKEKAKILWVGTRWSLNDPIGKRIDILQSDKKFENRRYRVLNVPALNDKDESNFDYSYNVGFSTEYYQQKRASFERNDDIASWNAQYMGEPIEREGTLFNPSDMQYFDGILPDDIQNADGVYLAVDPAWGGGDYVAAPVGVQFGSLVYIIDVVFSNEDKTKTQPSIVNLIIRNKVRQAQFEGTKATSSYAEDVQKMVRNKGYQCSVLIKPASTNTSKENRIFEQSPDIRNNFVFINAKHRTKEYNLFMQQVFSFKWEGKNKHDDAPDSLAMLSTMIFKAKRKIEFVKRPF